MARPKKRNPVLSKARSYFDAKAPDLKDSQIVVRCIEGPPGSPRFAATAEACETKANCPYGVPEAVADAGHCPIHDCGLRHTVRLLMDRSGRVLKETSSGIHWNAPADETDEGYEAQI